MGSGSGESSNGDSQSCLVGGSSSNREAGNFQCNICLDLAQEPVVTLCGHLFCWPCLYEWLHDHSRSSECPVCKATVVEEEIVPLYCGGNSSTHPQYRSTTRVDIPSRPAAGRRLATAPQLPSDANHIYHHDMNHIHHTAGWTPATALQPQPDLNYIYHRNMNHIHHHEPWDMASNHLAGTRLGNFTFPNAPTNHSAAARNQMAGVNQRNFMFQDATANDVDHGSYANVFHSLPAHGFHHGHGQHSYWFHHGHGPRAYGFSHAYGFWRHANRGRQVDVMWNLLLFLFLALIISNIIS